ncbi:MAG: helix-turn-helix domain-containing protein [Candidatus Omnitrophota bacterium]|nr:MAG: helix-turn-helix domain-containing protein [Candidatus Omnitrophota bacterium]
MNKRDIGQEILEGVREIKQYKKGNTTLRIHEINEPRSPKEIRKRLNLSQSAFAGLLGVSCRTLQDWEQGRRRPQGPAKTLLRIVDQHPEIFISDKREYPLSLNEGSHRESLPHSLRKRASQE